MCKNADNVKVYMMDGEPIKHRVAPPSKTLGEEQMQQKQRGYVEGVFVGVMTFFVTCLITVFLMGIGVGAWLWK